MYRQCSAIDPITTAAQITRVGKSDSANAA
jgi:hypothetical protein